MKTFRMIALKNQKGTIFVTTLVSLFMMTLVGGSIFTLTSQDMHFVRRLEKSTQAQSLAEAGLARAFAGLRQTWATSGTYGPTTLDNGSFTATVTTTGGRTLVTSVGTVQGVSRTAKAEVTAPGISALSYVFAGGGDVEIDSGTSSSPGTITGDLYAGAELELDGPSTGGSLVVTGDIDSVGDIEVGSDATVSGTQTTPFTQSVTFPTVSFSYYQTIAQANDSGTNDTYIDTDITYTTAAPIPAAPVGGVIYVNGDITIEGTQSTTACLVASGDILIHKGSAYPYVTITAPTQSGNVKYPALLAGGNITYTTTGNASPNAYLTITGLVYAGGNFNVNTGNHASMTVTGQILARGEIDVSPTAFTLNNASYLANTAPPGMDLGTSAMTIESYNQ
jgi:Tfp pilus assembly protein PilX